MAARVDPLDRVVAARDARKNGATRYAEATLRDVIDRYPSCAEAYSQLGILLYEADRLEEARTMFVTSLRIEESQPCLNFLGSIEQKLGHKAAALAALRRSLELMPDDDEAHHILALTLMDDEPLEAIAHFQRAHEIDPKLPHVLREWGRALWRAKRLDEAIDKLRDALAFDPGDAFGHSYMGAVLLEAGELLEAKRYLTRALELDPDDEMARDALADLER